MAGTRKPRVPMLEQIRLINECRQSGMTDANWCRENDIAVSTFYNWVSRCRKTAADQIPAANYGHLEVPRPKQDVVPIDIVPDHIPEQHTASQMLNSNLDNSHTIEVSMKDIMQILLERECNRNCVSFSNLLSRFYQMPELSVKAGTLTLTGIPAFKAR